MAFQRLKPKQLVDSRNRVDYQRSHPNVETLLNYQEWPEAPETMNRF